MAVTRSAPAITSLMRGPPTRDATLNDAIASRLPAKKRDDCNEAGTAEHKAEF
jgi:hypothetical protein